jgi:competence protein ComEC
MILWGYAFLTGLSSSVVRAVSMCCIYGVGSLTGRRLISMHVLSLVAFILIIARPHIVYEAGFQLSFTAVAGIVLLYPRFMVLFPFRRIILRRLAQMVSVSLSAQLSTMPLAILYFNQFAPGSILANLLVIPLATIILYGGLLYFIISGSGLQASFPASVLEFLSSGLYKITKVVAELPGAYFEGLTLSVPQVILFYLCAGLLIRYLQYKLKFSMFALLTAIILFLAVSAGREVRIRRQTGIYVFSLPCKTAVGFIKGREAGLYLPEVDRPGQIAQHGLPYSIEPFFRKRKLRPVIIIRMEQDVPAKATSRGRDVLPFLRHWSIHSHALEADFFLYMGTRILILRNWDGSCVNGLPSLETDILLLCNNTPIQIDRIISYFNPQQVLADNSNYASYCREFQSACKKAGIPFSSSHSNGCIILE